MTADRRAPEKAERYRYLRELGRGAMGVVDLVHDEVRATDVARKRVLQLTSESRYHLKQEFRHAQGIRHPNLVQLYDLFDDQDDVFFTMEHVHGQDITAAVRAFAARSGVAPEEVVAYAVAQIRQLVEAVAALHAAGIVHRDIKPSNVLVDGTDRVVLLDFGFSRTVGSSLSDLEDGALVGTIPYMAPECLWGALADERSDWYSVGALAAELFLERPLFSGSLQDLLRLKDNPIESLQPACAYIPPEVDELVCGWLSREPSKRTSRTQEIFAVLSRDHVPTPPPPRVSGITTSFIGRARELAWLEDAVPPEPRARLIRIHGPSGIGKSALAREFTRRLSERPGWLVFRGRCHPREHLALKALDAVVDDISHYVRHSGAKVGQRVAAIPGMTVLTKMFPTLAVIPEVGQIDLPAPLDPQRRWLQSVGALRALLEELEGTARIAIWIDDLQWADKDGLRLLHELIAVEHAPKITWVVSQRSAAQTMDDPAAPLWRAAPPGSLDLALTGFGDEEATELSIRLGVPRVVASQVAREAAGSPFLVSELARLAAVSGRVSTVDSIVEDRLGLLGAQERAVAEQLALAEEPLPVEVIRAQWGAAATTTMLRRLESISLARSGHADRLGELFELHHDRIRETLLSGIDAKTRCSVHMRLAHALERLDGVRSATVAFHYRRAGARERGLQMTLRAAAEFNDSLAFDQAADLYEAALELDPNPSAALLQCVGQALALAGRCEQAAAVFVRAASKAQDQTRKAEFAWQAGVHYLYVGRTVEARAVLQEALRAHGLGWPRFPLAGASLARARLVLRKPTLASSRPESRI